MEQSQYRSKCYSICRPPCRGEAACSETTALCSTRRARSWTVNKNKRIYIFPINRCRVHATYKQKSTVKLQPLSYSAQERWHVSCWKCQQQCVQCVHHAFSGHTHLFSRRGISLCGAVRWDRTLTWSCHSSSSDDCHRRLSERKREERVLLRALPATSFWGGVALCTQILSSITYCHPALAPVTARESDGCLS